MKIEVPLLAGLLLFAQELLARLQAQGFEAALVSSGVEYGFRAVRVGWKLLNATPGRRAA